MNTSLLKSLAISSVDQFNPALVISYIYLYLKVKTSLSGYNLTAQVTLKTSTYKLSSTSCKPFMGLGPGQIIIKKQLSDDTVQLISLLTISSLQCFLS